MSKNPLNVCKCLDYPGTQHCYVACEESKRRSKGIFNEDPMEIVKALLRGFSDIVKEPDMSVEVFIHTETRVYKILYECEIKPADSVTAEASATPPEPLPDPQ
jgi:hypothetical protein